MTDRKGTISYTGNNSYNNRTCTVNRNIVQDMVSGVIQLNKYSPIFEQGHRDKVVIGTVLDC